MRARLIHGHKPDSLFCRTLAVVGIVVIICTRNPNQSEVQLRAADVVLAICRLSVDQVLAPTSAMNSSCAFCQ